MRIRKQPVLDRILYFLFLTAIVVAPVVWLTLDHPPQRAEFHDSCESFIAFVGSERSYFYYTVDITTRSISVKPSGYLRVSEEYDLYPEYHREKPDRLPVLVTLYTTEETVTNWELPLVRPENDEESTDQLPEAIIFGSQATLEFADDTELWLGTKEQVSLELDRTESETVLVITVENPSDRDRTLHVGSGEHPQSFSILVDERPFPDGVLAGRGDERVMLTICLNTSGEVSASQSGTSWSGVEVCLSNEASVLLWSVPMKRTQGRFQFWDTEGYLSIAAKSTPAHFSRLEMILKDLFVELSAGSITVCGSARTISSGTTGQILPSRWDGMSMLWQTLISSICLAVLASAFGFLFWRLKT